MATDRARQPRTIKIGKGAGAGVVVLGTAAVFAFLSQWESSGKPILTVYADQLAGGIPTVCDGLTRHVTTTPIIVGETWPLEKCIRETEAAVIRVQYTLASCFDLAPPQTVFDAGTSHAWNFGVGATCSSAAMAAWNRSEWRLGCRRLQFGDDGRLVWAYVKTGRKLPNGKPEYRFIQGLANRRAAEHGFCISWSVPA